MDISGLILLLVGLTQIVWGMHGVVNKKRVSNVTHFILSIGQIMCGVLILAVVVLFYLTDWGEKLREVLMK
jgi:hypothetical protein